MSDKSNKKIDKKIDKKELEEYCNNELFKLLNGYWKLNKSGKNCGYHIAFKLDNVKLPDKIYKTYNNPPLDLPHIEYVKYMIDYCEVNSFGQDLLFKKDGITPKKYSILIKFNGTGFNNRFYVCYDYQFSEFKYPSIKKYNLNYIENIKKEIENFKKEIKEYIKTDLEYKLFILQKIPSRL
jgi:hypothetical protein